DTTTALTDAYSGTNPRSATSSDGTNFWTGGAAGGVRRAASLGATTSTVISSTFTNNRVVSIFSGQLYVSGGAGGLTGVATVGSGLPTTTGQTATQLPGTATSGTNTPSPYDFLFTNSTTLYVADDRTVANGGGIQKWLFN